MSGCQFHAGGTLDCILLRTEQTGWAVVYDPGKATAEHPERDANHGSKPETQRKRRRVVRVLRVNSRLNQRLGKLANVVARTGQPLRRRQDPLLRLAPGHEPPEAEADRDRRAD